MSYYLIKNAQIVNEGRIYTSDILIHNDRIERIDPSIYNSSAIEINAEGLFLFPGVIDDQVHFREPGLTHKGEIFTESRAAVAGGVTSFMEMPNTIPNTLTQELLEEKYKIASQKSLANYSFYMGVSNTNYDEVMRTDRKNVCGIKIFMGSSTGDMLVDDQNVLNRIFLSSGNLIATHCEDEAIIKKNTAKAVAEYGDNIPTYMHPEIRSEEACFVSSSLAVALATKYKTRLHVLHISTAKELLLFRNNIPLKEKRITAEACIHHLWFDDSYYDLLGNKIKWNPAVKTKDDKEAIMAALNSGVIDVIATDHAPHTWEEKSRPYLHAPSGGPLVQHSLVAMLELHFRNKITLEKIAEKMSHAVADCFKIEDRGYIREGYYADLALVSLSDRWTVNSSNTLAKCGWSPFENQKFNSKVKYTFVSGHLAYENGKLNDQKKGMRLSFSNS